jgi:anti-sigma factor RsiW
MNPGKPSWQELNAYVDGELSASDAAAVARALADDRILAEAVATLSLLKAATQESLEPFALAPTAAKRRSWRKVALAASLAAALLIAAVVSFRPWDTAPQPPVWLAGAWQVHATWAQNEPAGVPAAVESGVLLAALHRAGPEAFLPDLSDARLTLSRLEIVTLPGASGEVLYAGYLGTRGCQVSLLVLSSGGGLTQTLTRYDRGAGRAYGWRGARNGYLLLADGMDENRLALLAETVRQASLERQPLDPTARTALRQSRETSVPCLS